MVANYRPLRAPVYFTCLAQSSDPDLGTVTGSGKYLAGETVTLTAHPGERADFAGWMDEEGQLVSQESRYSFSITQDIILTAQFVRIYAVLVSVEPEGSGTVQGAGNYRQGQEAVLAAQESEGWLFTAWTEQGETVEASPEYRFVVDRDRTLAARFAVRCIITLLPGLEGAGTATGAGAYPYGSQVTLTASPAEGYRFLGWQNAAGETVSTELSYTFTITEAVVLQYAANAACCVFYQDRTGRIRIEPLNAQLEDYSIDRFVSYANAELTLTKPLRSVDVNNGQFVFTAGRKGEVQSLSNPLLTEEQAPAAARWTADYLQNRRVLSGSYRADPRLDPLDLVRLENQFAQSIVLITNVEYTYNGAFRGSYTSRGMMTAMAQYYYAGDLYAGEV